MYHMISELSLPGESQHRCSPKLFARHMAYLSSRRKTVVSLSDIARYLNGDCSLANNSVAVTLDDGYRDNFEHAFPILKEYDLPATIFLAAGLVGEDVGIFSGETSSPAKAMLTWSQIREMRKTKIEFGSHTITHPRLSKLSREEAEKEITLSKVMIESQLGCPVDSFAYPYGDHTREHKQIAIETGYTIACSARSGFNRPESDPFLLRRIEVHGNDSVWNLALKIKFGSNDGGIFLPLNYYWNRIRDRGRKLWRTLTGGKSGVA